MPPQPLRLASSNSNPEPQETPNATARDYPDSLSQPGLGRCRPGRNPICAYVGNSYTIGRVDPVMSYNAANVRELMAAIWAANPDCFLNYVNKTLDFDYQGLTDTYPECDFFRVATTTVQTVARQPAAGASAGTCNSLRTLPANGFARHDGRHRKVDGRSPTS